MTPFTPGRYITVFTDASYDQTTGAFGWAAWIKFGERPDTHRISGAGFVKGSTAAEIQALTHAVEHIIKNIPLEDRIVVLQSDSTRAIDQCVELVPLCIKHGAEDAYFKHVRGHQINGDSRAAVNTWCDREARQQMRRLRRETQRNLSRLSQT